MSITSFRKASYYDAYIKELFIVEIDGTRVGFDHVDDANAAFKALTRAKGIGYIYSVFDCVSYRLAEKNPPLEQSRSRVLDYQGDLDTLSKEGVFFRLRCDHHIVKDSDVCGVSVCYENVEMHRQDDTPEGWFVFNLNDSKSWDDPVVDRELEGVENDYFHVCCPDCVKRFADDLECEPSEVTRNMVKEAFDFENEVIERAKEDK